MARHNSIFAAVACAAVALTLAAAPAQANITWQWSFESEAGTFMTDGSLVGGVAPAGSYTADPDSLNVTASTIPALIGATFTQNQTPQGLLWDGSEPTQFWRTAAPGVLYTNGMNFFGPHYWYGFGIDDSGIVPVPAARLYDATGIDYFVMLTGPLTVRPVATVTVPVPASIGLVAMGLLSIRRFRRR